MSIHCKVYDNGDHTAIIWVPADSKPIDDCRGFTIQREHNGTQDYLHSFIGFSEDAKPDPENPWKWPVQRYMWWDYFVKPGDKVIADPDTLPPPQGHRAVQTALHADGQRQ